MPKYLALFLLLSLSSIAIRAQQAAPNSDENTKNPISATYPALTADGTRACRRDLNSKTPPAGWPRMQKGTLPPTVLYIPKAPLSDEALAYIKEYRIKDFSATSLVSMTVDEKGKPQDICIVKEAGYGLDRKAFEAVEKYRFKSATLNGKPVSLRVDAEVRFPPD